jgi:hypothetical protein
MEAEKPLLLVGRGAKHPSRRNTIETIASQSGAVITSTWQMDGYFSENYAGCIGICGTPSANEAFFQSDLLIAIGTSVNMFITSKGPETIAEFKYKTIQVDESNLRDSYFVDSWAEPGIEETLQALAEKQADPWFEHTTYGMEQLRQYVPAKMRAVADVLRTDYPGKTVTLGAGNAVVWLPAALGPEIKKESSRVGSMGEMVAGLNRESNPILALRVRDGSQSPHRGKISGHCCHDSNYQKQPPWTRNRASGAAIWVCPHPETELPRLQQHRSRIRRYPSSHPRHGHGGQRYTARQLRK